MFILKLIYKPLGITAGLLSAVLASKVFKAVWGLVDEEEPPKPNVRDVSWPKVLAAAALQGMTFKVMRVAVDRSVAKGFEHVTGGWPGPRTQEPAGD